MSETANTLYYLAYGSNMNSTIFTGRRKIKPLEKYPCRVPGWTLNFDMIGFPYVEPAFASIHKITDEEKNVAKELHGVVYLITKDDYLQIRRTEGGGGYENLGYNDIDVEVITYDGRKLTARTLVAHSDWKPTTFVLPSERYIKLLRDGAREHGLEEHYINFLEEQVHYNRTGLKKYGMYTILAVCLPFLIPAMTFMLLLPKIGIRPPRIIYVYMYYAGKVMWFLHDWVWRYIFGSGCNNK
jgi:hypothetical protein